MTIATEQDDVSRATGAIFAALSGRAGFTVGLRELQSTALVVEMDFLPGVYLLHVSKISDRFESWRHLLGRRVAVTLDRDPLIKQSGILLEFTEDGEVDIRDSMGVTHYCWPCLDIEPLGEEENGG